MNLFYLPVGPPSFLINLCCIENKTNIHTTTSKSVLYVILPYFFVNFLDYYDIFYFAILQPTLSFKSQFGRNNL